MDSKALVYLSWTTNITKFYKLWDAFDTKGKGNLQDQTTAFVLWVAQVFCENLQALRIEKCVMVAKNSDTRRVLGEQTAVFTDYKIYSI